MTHDLFSLGCTFIESMYAPTTDIRTYNIDTWKVRLQAWVDDAGVAHPPHPCVRALPGVVAGAGPSAPMDTHGTYWAFNGSHTSLEYVLWRMTQFPVAQRVSEVDALEELVRGVDSGDLLAMLHRRERADALQAQDDAHRALYWPRA
jgi:hypothetical protein